MRVALQPLAGRPLRSYFRWNGHSNTNRRPSMGHRLDRNCPVNKPDSFLHACETQPSALLCRSKIKPPARIADCELYLIRVFTYLDVDPFHAAILHGIV